MRSALQICKHCKRARGLLGLRIVRATFELFNWLETCSIRFTPNPILWVAWHSLEGFQDTPTLVPCPVVQAIRARTTSTGDRDIWTPWSLLSRSYSGDGQWVWYKLVRFKIQKTLILNRTHLHHTHLPSLLERWQMGVV